MNEPPPAPELPASSQSPLGLGRPPPPLDTGPAQGWQEDEPDASLDAGIAEFLWDRWWSVWVSHWNHWRRYLVPRTPEYDPSEGRRSYLLIVYVVRRFFIEDRCGGMAAVLTLHTLLSMVPTFGVALLVVGLMDEAAGARLLRDLFHSIVPETSRAGDMAEEALNLASNVTLTNLGAWGFMATLAIAFVLFQTLEDTFNRIWRVARKRSVLVKFTMFYTLATLGPLLMLYSLAQQLLPGLSSAIAYPLLTTSVGLVLLNRFLPYTEVRWRAALVAGVSSALALELGKIGFGFYVTRIALRTYDSLYGPFAVLPVLIAWSYLSWCMILMGAQLAFVFQHRRAISLLGYMNRYVLNRRMIQRPSASTAARIMLAICDRYARQRMGLTTDALAERFGLGIDLISEVVERLHTEGLLIEAERPPEVHIPGRPLDQIRIIDILQMFDLEHARRVRDDRLSAVLAAVSAARRDVVGTMTYADLVQDTRGSSPRIG